jgi:hypothetical protein
MNLVPAGHRGEPAPRASRREIPEGSSEASMAATAAHNAMADAA